MMGGRIEGCGKGKGTLEFYCSISDAFGHDELLSWGV